MNRKAGIAAGVIASVMLAIGLFDGRKNMKNQNPIEPLTPVDNPRQAIIDAAETQIGTQNPEKYWSDVLPNTPGFKGEWCGGFALWAIHQARLGLGMNWEIGKGFCYHLPRTTDPLPGDVAYFDKPYQHHAIVEKVDGDTLHTIDGNQSGSTVQRRTRSIHSVTAFYSIQPLIDESHTPSA